MLGFTAKHFTKIDQTDLEVKYIKQISVVILKFLISYFLHNTYITPNFISSNPLRIFILGILLYH